jgi:hypothetical protein
VFCYQTVAAPTAAFAAVVLNIACGMTVSFAASFIVENVFSP